MNPVRRLGLLVNFTRPRVREGLEALLKAAREADIALLTPPAEAAAHDLVPCAAKDFAAQGAQGVISLGGDGSLLAAAHALTASDLPLIGLNIGRLGYLTAVNEEGFGGTLQALAEGRYALEARTALAAEAVRNGAVLARLPDALNDIVVSRAEGGRAFALRLELDGFPVARWLCDGLILATPTGSTAYSLSVGGPVVAPAGKALVVSVIAPHALSARPLVVPDSSRIIVRIDDEEASATAYSDGGHAVALRSGDAVCASASPRIVRLMVPEGHNPYAPLARKLGWGAPFSR